MKGLLSLIRRTTPSSFTYICEKNGDSLTDKVNFVYNSSNAPLIIEYNFYFRFLMPNYLQMDELACFAPGMIALGSSGYGPDESQKFLSLAEEVSTIIENSYIRTSVLCASVFVVWFELFFFS